MWLDISKSILSGCPLWPGSIKPKIVRHRDGECISSDLVFNLHTATHIDAPEHFIKNGKQVTDIDINDLCGSVQIIDVLGNRCILPSDVPNITEKFVFFKTINTPGKTFDPNYCYITPELAYMLCKKYVKVVGTDCLSVEEYSSFLFLTHKILMKNDIVLVEGLNLEHVKPGIYEAMIIPISIEAEAAPARVLLRKS